MSTSIALKRRFHQNVTDFEESYTEFLESFGENEGLDFDNILKFIGLIESTEIKTPLKFKLMSRLIPKEPVIHEEAFIRMTCLLSDFNFNLNLKVEIVKWMISLYSFVDDLTNFLDLYEIFLHLLEYELLRPYVVHLLHKMTRKEHVTLTRMNYIIKLLKRVEPQPSLTILSRYILQSFTEYVVDSKKDWEFDFEPLGIYPNLIKHLHPSYNGYIPTQYILSNEKYCPVPPSCIRVEKAIEERCTEILTQKDSHSPAIEKSPGTDLDVTYEFPEIFKEIKNMEKPINIKKILKSKFRRLFLTSDITKTKKTSVEDFILVSVYINLREREKEANIDFLHGDALDIFDDMLVPEISSFTKKLIEQCDGSSGLDIILRILSYEPVCCFADIEYKINAIRKKLLNASIFEKCDLINGFSKLYQNWALTEFHINNNYIVPCMHEENCSLSYSSASRTKGQIHSATDEIYTLDSCIALICDMYLLENNFHPCLLNEVLLHYERVSMCHTRVNLTMFPPTTSVFHAALFSLNSVTLDNLCRLMLRYNREIEVMYEKFNPETQLAAKYFKRYRNDIEKVLFGGNYKSNGDITHLSKENVIERLQIIYPEFEKFFELYRHPALLQKSSSFIENYQLDILPSEINNLNPEVSSKFFTYLKKNGVENLAKYLTMSM